MSIESQRATRIVRNPDIQGGEPTIAGTRVAVRVIVLALKYDGSIEAVLQGYPHLTRADVEEALRFYDEHRDEIDFYIRENEDD
jgi:uncharacterized protein (DUF433 family)